MEVPLGHKVFVADHARLDEGRPPKQTTFLPLADGINRLNPIYDRVLTERLARVFVAEDTLHILNCTGQMLDPFTHKLTAAETSHDLQALLGCTAVAFGLAVALFTIHRHWP